MSILCFHFLNTVAKFRKYWDVDFISFHCLGELYTGRPYAVAQNVFL